MNVLRKTVTITPSGIEDQYVIEVPEDEDELTLMIEAVHELGGEYTYVGKDKTRTLIDSTKDVKTQIQELKAKEREKRQKRREKRRRKRKAQAARRKQAYGR